MCYIFWNIRWSSQKFKWQWKRLSFWGASEIPVKFLRWDAFKHPAVLSMKTLQKRTRSNKKLDLTYCITVNAVKISWQIKSTGQEVATVRSAEVSWQSWMFLAALAASLACTSFGQTVLTNDKTYWCRSQNNLFALLLIVFGQIAILGGISATFLGWGPKKRSVDH